MDMRDAGARRLVVAANRGPVSFQRGPEGELVLKRGLGGLVTVLNEVLGRRPGTWVAAAVGPEEAKLAEAGESVDITLDASSYRVRYVPMPREVYDQYDRIVANPMLWFLQHYLWDLGIVPAYHPQPTQRLGQRLPARASSSSPTPSSTKYGATTARSRWSCCTTIISTELLRWSVPPHRAPSSISSCTSLGRSRTPGWCCRSTSALPSSRVFWATTSSRSTPGTTRATSCRDAPTSSICLSTWPISA